MLAHAPPVAYKMSDKDRDAVMTDKTSDKDIEKKHTISARATTPGAVAVHSYVPNSDVTEKNPDRALSKEAFENSVAKKQKPMLAHAPPVAYKMSDKDRDAVMTDKTSDKDIEKKHTISACATAPGAVAAPVATPLPGAYRVGGMKPDRDEEETKLNDKDVKPNQKALEKEVKKKLSIENIRPESLPKYVRRKDRKDSQTESTTEETFDKDVAEKKRLAMPVLARRPSVVARPPGDNVLERCHYQQEEKEEITDDNAKVVEFEAKCAPVAFDSRAGGFYAQAGKREEQATQDVDKAVPNEPNEYLVEAHTVEDPILVTAKPDSWLRRNRCWIVGGCIILVIVIVTVIILTAVNMDGPDPPTASPTTVEEGIEEQIKGLIVSQLPIQNEILSNKEMPQHKALQWIVEQQYNDGSSWYTAERVLVQYGLAVLFLSTTFAGKDETGSSFWINSDGWMEEIDECDWYGVLCDEKSSIVGLNLTENNLAGSIPVDITLLSSLLSLDLSGNALSGSLPLKKFKPIDLVTLNLAQNSLSGGIPISFSELTKLAILNLSDNSLSSTIPTEIGDAIALTTVNLANNKMSGSIPSEIGNLSDLEELDCRNNALSYELPSEIGNLRTLSTLYLQHNKLLGPLPSEIGLMSSLHTWNMSDNHVFDKIPNVLWQGSALENLASLDLSHNLLTGEGSSSDFHQFGESWNKLTSLRLFNNFFRGNIEQLFQRTDNFPSLEEFDLSFNFFHGTVPDDMFDMRKLKRLNLHNCGIEGSIPTEIGSLAELTTLMLAANQFTGSVPSQLGNLMNIKELRLDYNKLKEALPSEVGKLDQLEQFTASNNELSMTIPSEIGTLDSLKVLSLWNNRLTGTIPLEVGSLIRLEVLYLYDNQLTGPIPSEVDTLVGLEKLRLDFNRFSGTIPSQIGNLASIKEISLEYNQFNGAIPSEIGKLDQLEFLAGFENKLTGAIPSEIGTLDSLTWLGLWSNQFSGTIPSELGSLTGVNFLYLSNNKLTGMIPSEIGSLVGIKALYLDSNDLNGNIPTEIGYLVQLEKFQLSGNSLSGLIPSEITNMVKMEDVRLNTNDLSGSIPYSVCKMDPVPAIAVECEEVICRCCNPACTQYTMPTLSPFPSTSPSTSKHPSLSQIPSLVPSRSFMPTSSLAPTRQAVIVTIEIQLDTWAGATGWNITDSANNTIHQVPAGTYRLQLLNTVYEKVSLDSGLDYTFHLLNSEGYGLRGRVILYLGDTPGVENILGYYVDSGDWFYGYEIPFVAHEDGIIESVTPGVFFSWGLEQTAALGVTYESDGVPAGIESRLQESFSEYFIPNTEPNIAIELDLGTSGKIVSGASLQSWYLTSIANISVGVAPDDGNPVVSDPPKLPTIPDDDVVWTWYEMGSVPGCCNHVREVVIPDVYARYVKFEIQGGYSTYGSNWGIRQVQVSGYDALPNNSTGVRD